MKSTFLHSGRTAILFAFLLFCLAGVAGADVQSVTHSTSSGYVPGQTITVSNTFSYDGTLLSLLWKPTLPTGWTIEQVTGDGSPEYNAVFGEILWTGSLPASPIQMEYTIRVPEDESGSREITGEVVYAFLGMVNPATAYAQSNPLSLGCAAPTVDDFSVDTSQICNGGSALLSWNTSYATQVDISGVGTGLDTDGTIEVSPSSETTYTLTASNPCGSDTGQVTVTVLFAPSVDNFTATSGEICAGSSVDLSWNTTGVDEVDINGTGGLDADGSTQVTPGATTVYTLTATNTCGSDTDTLTVTVNSAPVIDSFTADSNELCTGGSAELSWATTYANSVDITHVGTGLSLDGSAQVEPVETTVYSLSAVNQCGTTTSDVTLTVNNVPEVVSFTADSNEVNEGEAVELSWSLSRAASADIDSGVGDVNSEGGTTLVYPDADTTYTLSALNSCGTSTDTVTITVNPPLVDVAQEGSGYRSPGPAFVKCTVSYPAERALESLSYTPTLPEGWVLVDAVGDGQPGIQGAAVVFEGDLTPNPLEVTLEMDVPEAVDEAQALSGRLEYTLNGQAHPGVLWADPASLLLEELHDGDYEDPLWMIDGTEASRLMAYWRAGGYHCDPLGSDGFAPGSGDQTCERNSADFQESAWVIDGTEINRALAYWRAGGYHPDAEGADGFAPGFDAGSTTALASSNNESERFAASHTGEAFYTPGEETTFHVTLEYSGALLSLLWRPNLPAGWEIIHWSGDGAPEMVRGDIVWTGTVPESPVTLQYTVRVPENASGLKQVFGEAHYHMADSSNDRLCHADRPVTLRSMPGDSLTPVGGIYKSSNPVMNFFVQTYTNGSAVVLATPDLTSWTAYRDSDWTDGISASSETGGGSLAMRFNDEDGAVAVVRDPRGRSIHYTLRKVFTESLQRTGVDGCYRERGGSGSFLFVQTYTTDAVQLILTPDLLQWKTFLDRDVSDGVEGTLQTDGHSGRLSLTPLGGEEYLVEISDSNGTSNQLKMNRTLAIPDAAQEKKLVGSES